VLEHFEDYCKMHSCNSVVKDLTQAMA